MTKKDRRAWRLQFGSDAHRLRDGFRGCARCQGFRQAEHRPDRVKVSVRKCWLHGVCLCKHRGLKLQALQRRWSMLRNTLECGERNIVMCLRQLTPNHDEVLQEDWYYVALQVKKPCYSILVRMDLDAGSTACLPAHRLLKIASSSNVPQYLTEVECFNELDLRNEARVRCFGLVETPNVVFARPPAIMEVAELPDAEITLWRGSAQEQWQAPLPPAMEAELEEEAERPEEVGIGEVAYGLEDGEAEVLRAALEGADEFENCSESDSSSSSSSSSSVPQNNCENVVVAADPDGMQLEAAGLAPPREGLAPLAEALAPMPEALVGRQRRRHPGSYDWCAAFSFTFRPGGASSGATWQATCKVHPPDVSGTRCTRSRVLGQGEQDPNTPLSLQAQQELKHWCLASLETADKMAHKNLPRGHRTAFTDDEMEEQKERCVVAP